MNQYDQNLSSINLLDYNDYFDSILLGGSSICDCDFEFKPVFRNAVQLEQDKQSPNKTVTSLNTYTFECNVQKIGFQPRRKSQIEFSSIVRQRVYETIQGSKDDTMDLNVNFKTIIVNVFKELIILNELTTQQTQQVMEFISRPPSFKSLYMLCWCASPKSSIRQKLRSMIESKRVMMRILSNRSGLSTKLQMIKFVEVLRRNVAEQKGIIKWKQLLQK